MFRWLRRREAAQSLVEFSLIIPLFIILVFGVIDFGMGLRAYITVAQATREGARFGSVGNPGPAGTVTSCSGTTPGTVVDKVCSTMNGLNLASVSSISVTYPNGDSPGNSVRVTVTYNYKYITPISRMVNFFSAGALGSTIPVNSTTDMRIE